MHPLPMLIVAALLSVGDGELVLHAERRELREVLKRNDPDEVVTAARRYSTHADAQGAVRLLLETLELLEQLTRRALEERDEQGAEGVVFFERHLALLFDPTAPRGKQYLEILQRNHELCQAVNLRVQEAGLFGDALRAQLVLAGTGQGLVPPAGLAALLDDRLRRSPVAEARRRMIEAVPDVFVTHVRTRLRMLAGAARTRGERLAALRALSRSPAPGDAAHARTACGNDDPVVRRTGARLAAAIALRMRREEAVVAMDVLIAQTALESGVPALELALHLARITGRPAMVGTDRWRRWWVEARADWVPPSVLPGTEDTEFPAGASRPGDDPSLSDRTWRYHGLRLHSRRVVFVLDTSGSMIAPVDSRGGLPLSGDIDLDRARITLARRELIEALERLPPEATFSVIAYDSRVNPFSKHLVPADAANLRKVKKWLSRLRPEGGTNVHAALEHALAMGHATERDRDRRTADTILFLSDGDPSCGLVANEVDLLPEIARWDPDGMLTIHTIALGHEISGQLMEQLAQATGGQFTRVMK